MLTATLGIPTIDVTPPSVASDTKLASAMSDAGKKAAAPARRHGFSERIPNSPPSSVVSESRAMFEHGQRSHRRTGSAPPRPRSNMNTMSTSVPSPSVRKPREESVVPDSKSGQAPSAPNNRNHEDADSRAPNPSKKTVEPHLLPVASTAPRQHHAFRVKSQDDQVPPVAEDHEGSKSKDPSKSSGVDVSQEIATTAEVVPDKSPLSNQQEDRPNSPSPSHSSRATGKIVKIPSITDSGHGQPEPSAGPPSEGAPDVEPEIITVTPEMVVNAQPVGETRDSLPGNAASAQNPLEIPDQTRTGAPQSTNKRRRRRSRRHSDEKRDNLAFSISRQPTWAKIEPLRLLSFGRGNRMRLGEIAFIAFIEVTMGVPIKFCSRNELERNPRLPREVKVVRTPTKRRESGHGQSSSGERKSSCHCQ